MIDIEAEVFTAVATQLRGAFTDIYVTGEYVSAPPKFPAVSVIEMDNLPVRETQTSSQFENHAAVAYEVNVYSAKKSGRKTECRNIMKKIDESMNAIGFYRTMLEPMPNFADASIFRLVARYSAIVGRDKTVYRR